MANSRIHYVEAGELAVCGVPWRSKRRTRVRGRETCVGCKEWLAVRPDAEDLQGRVGEAYSAAELDAIVLVDSLFVVRQYMDRLGRTAVAQRLSQIERCAQALREEVRLLAGGLGAPAHPQAHGGACPACSHGTHVPGACSAMSGSLLSLALRPCPCAAGADSSPSPRVREVHA